MKEILGSSFPETRTSDPSGPEAEHPRFYSIKIDEFDPPRFFVARIHVDFLADLDDPQTIASELERLDVIERMRSSPNHPIEVMKDQVQLGRV